MPHGPRRLPAARVRQQRVGETLYSLVDERVGFVGLWDERVVVSVDRAAQGGQADLAGCALISSSTVRVAAGTQPRTNPKNGPKSRVAGKPVTNRPGRLVWK